PRWPELELRAPSPSPCEPSPQPISLCEGRWELHRLFRTSGEGRPRTTTGGGVRCADRLSLAAITKFAGEPLHLGDNSPSPIALGEGEQARAVPLPRHHLPAAASEEAQPWAGFLGVSA